jgi:hypothetical protein
MNTEKTSLEPQNQPSCLGDVSGSTWFIPIIWFEKIFCKHKDRTELHRCYQDRYVSEVCNNCRKVIYSDI